jgi:hypothetical protein
MGRYPSTAASPREYCRGNVIGATFRRSLSTYRTSLLLVVDWSKTDPGITVIGTPAIRLKRKSDGKLFTEADFTRANNLAPVTDGRIVSGKQKGVHVAGDAAQPYANITDQYDLLIDITTAGGKPFSDATVGNLTLTTTSHYPKPVIDTLAAPPSVLRPRSRSR